MTRDDYRYELPDFILGKLDPETAKAMEHLIETDANFRAEFLEMKSLIEYAAPKLNAAFETPTDAYFEALSEKVMAKVLPHKKSWWTALKEAARAGFQLPHWQWAGGALAATLALALIVLTKQLDPHTYQPTQAKTNPYEDKQALLLIATKTFAMGITPEMLTAQINEDEAEEMLNILESSVPAGKPIYKVLTGDEVEQLLKSL